jgi:sodium transport system ATP-binding protein
MIRVESVSKRFGDVVAVDEVAFVAADAAITAVLGQNGAGKTTTLRIMTTLLPPDRGRVLIDDVDVVVDPLGARRRFGALSHAQGLYTRLTPREHVAYFGRLHGMPEAAIARRTEELFTLLEMADIADRRTEGFSQGQKLKVALARALVHSPRHLVLDEPTAGLDVKGIRAVRRFLQAERAAGRCVVLSTHVMQEVAALADQLVIVARGRVVATGTADELRARTGENDLEDAFVAVLGGDEALQ